MYFAVQASYSARSTFSPPNSSGMKYMYLARVLTGEYTVGKSGIRVPPSKQNPNDPTEAFDTVVDQIPNPNIFVTFYDWQCYPEYLISFQWESLFHSWCHITGNLAVATIVKRKWSWFPILSGWPLNWSVQISQVILSKLLKLLHLKIWAIICNPCLVVFSSFNVCFLWFYFSLKRLQ